MLRSTLRVLFAATLVMTACPALSWGIEISEIRWGYDGSATLQSFNLLSVLVSNSGSQPFDGTLELRDSAGGRTRVGAVLAEELYIAPNSSRWVQFYPYLKESFEEWSLEWGRRLGERADVPKPIVALHQPILLVDPDELPNRGGSIRHFPENLFPPMVTATDALRTVALDHVPRWEESRRQAFYDWLFRGGHLHLFKDVNGAYPQFSAGLAPLNMPAERFRVGQGEVFRHDQVRGQIDAKSLEKIREPNRHARGQTVDPDADEVEIEAGPVTVTARGIPSGGNPQDILFSDLTGGLFVFLKSLTRPHHNWTLIYSMAVVYVLTVVPGVHYLGRKRFDYRLVYGVLIGLIVLFSMGFAYFGRRGHEEANAVNSVAVARQLPGGALDITSWSNVFVINGADYAIAGAGTGHLYATAQAFEAVNGVIHNGPRGRFDVDIPPYSSQTFLHRVKLPGDPIEISVREFAADKKLGQLTLGVEKNFPRPADPDSVFVLYRDQIYPMSVSKDRLNLGPLGGQSLSDFLSSVHWNDFSPYSMGNRSGPFVSRPVGATDPQAEAASQLDTLEKPLVAWSLGLDRRSLTNFQLPDDRMRLFVWAEMPESLRIEDPRMRRQQGRVLYVVDVLKPVKP